MAYCQPSHPESFARAAKKCFLLLSIAIPAAMPIPAKGQITSKSKETASSSQQSTGSAFSLLRDLVTSKSKEPGATVTEDVKSQAKRLEMRSQENIGTSLEILRQLSKFSDAGDVALKNAAARTEAAMKRITGDSASFEVDLEKAREQLRRGRDELERVDGAKDIIAAYITQNVEPVAQSLTKSEAVSRTSLKVLESTAERIKSWQTTYKNFEEITGRDDALKKVKTLVEREIAELSKK